MNSFVDLIDRWPSIEQFASDAGVRYGTAQVMKFRDSIHPRYWQRIVEGAQRRGFEDVNADVLADLAAKRAQRSHPKSRAAYQPAA
jgi:hypothetical protein